MNRLVRTWIAAAFLSLALPGSVVWGQSSDDDTSGSAGNGFRLPIMVPKRDGIEFRDFSKREWDAYLSVINFLDEWNAAKGLAGHGIALFNYGKWCGALRAPAEESDELRARRGLPPITGWPAPDEQSREEWRIKNQLPKPTDPADRACFYHDLDLLDLRRTNPDLGFSSKDPRVAAIHERLATRLEAARDDPETTLTGQAFADLAAPLFKLMALWARMGAKPPAENYDPEEAQRALERAREQARIQRMTLEEKLDEMDRLLLQQGRNPKPSSLLDAVRNLRNAQVNRAPRPGQGPAALAGKPPTAVATPPKITPPKDFVPPASRPSPVFNDPPQRDDPPPRRRPDPDREQKDREDKPSRKSNSDTTYYVSYLRRVDRPGGGELYGTYSTPQQVQKAVAEIQAWAAQINNGGYWDIVQIVVEEDGPDGKKTKVINVGGGPSRDPQPTTDGGSAGGPVGSSYPLPRTNPPGYRYPVPDPRTRPASPRPRTNPADWGPSANPPGSSRRPAGGGAGANTPFASSGRNPNQATGRPQSGAGRPEGSPYLTMDERNGQGSGKGSRIIYDENAPRGKLSNAPLDRYDYDQSGKSNLPPLSTQPKPGPNGSRSPVASQPSWNSPANGSTPNNYLRNNTPPGGNLVPRQPSGSSFPGQSHPSTSRGPAASQPSWNALANGSTPNNHLRTNSQPGSSSVRRQSSGSGYGSPGGPYPSSPRFQPDARTHQPSTPSWNGTSRPSNRTGSNPVASRGPADGPVSQPRSSSYRPGPASTPSLNHGTPGRGVTDSSRFSYSTPRPSTPAWSNRGPAAGYAPTAPQTMPAPKGVKMPLSVDGRNFRRVQTPSTSRDRILNDPSGSFANRPIPRPTPPSSSGNSPWRSPRPVTPPPSRPSSGRPTVLP